MTEKPTLNRRISVAPMMDCTDRHDRYLLRLLSKHALLYTEMITTGALIHGQREAFLRYHPTEQPLALQLGGSDPDEMARCAVFAQQAGFAEVNINVGCPSDRVQNNLIGACLMAHADKVATCVAAMAAEVDVPITIKCRTGIDQDQSSERLYRLVDATAKAGAETFIVHARNAWLQGLSPKQNREVPPLQYDMVYQLKADYPELEVVLNGGVTDLDASAQHLQQCDGVMLGRAAYHNPYVMAGVDQRFFDVAGDGPTREQVLETYKAYMAAELPQGTPLPRMARHLLGLYLGQPGARIWRRYLSEHMYLPQTGLDVIDLALSKLQAVTACKPEALS